MNTLEINTSALVKCFKLIKKLPTSLKFLLIFEMFNRLWTYPKLKAVNALPSPWLHSISFCIFCSLQMRKQVGTIFSISKACEFQIPGLFFLLLVSFYPMYVPLPILLCVSFYNSAFNLSSELEKFKLVDKSFKPQHFALNGSFVNSLFMVWTGKHLSLEVVSVAFWCLKS